MSYSKKHNCTLFHFLVAPRQVRLSGYVGDVGDVQGKNTEANTLLSQEKVLRVNLAGRERTLHFTHLCVFPNISSFNAALHSAVVNTHLKGVLTKYYWQLFTNSRTIAFCNIQLKLLVRHDIFGTVFTCAYSRVNNTVAMSTYCIRVYTTDVYKHKYNIAPKSMALHTT